MARWRRQAGSTRARRPAPSPACRSSSKTTTTTPNSPSRPALQSVVKDNINTADMPTSAGTPALQNARPTSNAPSLQKLLDAGAIIIGKTNMHELAFGITSTNLSPFAGPVKNPYDKTRIPGGSSGGTSAAI